MNLYFHIEYRTVFGEELLLNIVAKDKDGQEVITSYRMSTADGVNWSYRMGNCHESHAINYFYSVDCHGSEKRHEWLTVSHRQELNVKDALCYEFYDRWTDIPEDSYLYSSAFTDCINRRERDTSTKAEGDFRNFVHDHSDSSHPTLRLIVRAPQLRSGQRLIVSGGNQVLGNWNLQQAVPMHEHNYNEWYTDIDATSFAGRRVEFKFVAVNDDHRTTPLWETCSNRIIELSRDMRNGDVIAIQLDQAFFTLANQHVAGTLVPVFSLRSKGSFGVGDFGDLRQMVDWVATTGQRLLQVLPINDTTKTHTWTDSYPYSCISVFALHPQYVDLRQLPAIKDKKLKAKYDALREELNALEQIDYERVNECKTEYLHIIFEQEGAAVMKSEKFKAFFKECKQWLVPYAQYCLLRDTTGTTDFTAWQGHSTWDEDDRRSLSNPRTKAYGAVAFYYFVQFILNEQMRAVHEHARSLGVILKGDIPIGVSRQGCDVWMEPSYFNMNGQAGAPPDDFSTDGQNWGFPTYNWDEMLKDDCAWWVRRFQNMSKFFDAYRIDHVLGFFRIWEIPVEYQTGLMGQFSPALGYTREEIESWGVYHEIENLFLIDHQDASKYHPRIAVQHTDAYDRLSNWEKEAFNRLYDNYFYHRNNQFWYHEAMKKLPRLVQATRMLVCAEDLGMVPQCVQWVMNELRILSLELESMPKDPGIRFGILANNPYRSVCTISSHDTPTLRMWWDEDIERSQTYFNGILWHNGPAPHPMPGWLAREIIARHLASPSMVCVIALQDWLAIDEQLRLADANAERVNIPANPNHYWRYRMHLNIEDLISCESFTRNISELVVQNGRR